MELPIEPIVNILLNLPYKWVLSYCSTSREATQVCQNDYFWKLKVGHEYYPVSMYKPPNISYRQQYRDLINASDPNKAAKEGRLDLLVALDQKGIHPNQWGANYAAENGHLNVLEWMDQQGYPHPDQDGANGPLRMVI